MPVMVTAQEYLEKHFEADRSAQSCTVHTGFRCFDETGGLYAGLYIIAGASSTGKTSFCIQLCEQIAAAGTDVIFFSLEHTAYDVICKGLSRRCYLSGKSINTRQISSQDCDQQALHDAESTLTAETGSRYNICQGAITEQQIEDEVKIYMKNHAGSKPVVVIDYLQIISSQPGDTGSLRERLDTILRGLKQFSLSENLVVFLISSLSRQGYYAPVTMDCLKETGGAEYSADVILGMQLSVIHEKEFSNIQKTGTARAAEKLLQAKMDNPRQVELSVLKDKRGTVGQRYHFSYYAAYNHFEQREDAQQDFADYDL